MFFKGGRETGFGRRETYTALAILVAVLATVAVLLAAPAWSKDTQSGKDPEHSGETTSAKSPAQTNDKTLAQDPTHKDALGDKTSSVSKILQTAKDSSSGDLAGKEVENNNGSDNNNIDLLKILDADNCDISPGATIVFKVTKSSDNNVEGTLVAVVEGVNVNIDGRENDVRVVSNKGSNNDIKFFTQDLDTQPLKAKDKLKVQSSTGIDCGHNNGGNHNKNKHNGSSDNNNHNNDNNNNSSNDTTEETTTEDTTDSTDTGSSTDNGSSTDTGSTDTGTNTTDDQYDSGTDTGTTDNTGTDATAGPDGATADTGGTTAGDQYGSQYDPGTGIDTQSPVSGPQGDVVDDVSSDEPLPPTGGPLPSTGGLPILALAPLLGVALVVAGSVVLRFGRRQR